MKKITKVFLAVLASACYLSWGHTLYQNSQLVESQEKSEIVLSEKSDEISTLKTQLDESNTSLQETKDILTEANAEKADLQAIIENTPNFSYQGEFAVTYYCGEDYPHICGTPNGETSSGAKAFAGVTVAADPNVLPAGSYVYIEGVGMRVVQDTGGGIQGNKLDVYVDTHDEALENGILEAAVWIVTRGDN